MTRPKQSLDVVEIWQASSPREEIDPVQSGRLRWSCWKWETLFRTMDHVRPIRVENIL